MAALKVHGSVISTATLRVLAALYEKGLDFEFIAVDMKSGAHKKESFLAKNPFGQVPVLEDGDLAIFESRAITQHIAHNHPDKGTELVFFSDPRKMTILTIWAEVESQQFDPHASKLAFEYVYKPMFGMGPASESTVAELEEKLSKVLDVYEARLSQNRYLSGDAFGLADLHHLPVIHMLMGSPAKRLFDARPHVSKWISEITARPAWAKVLAMQKSP